MASKSKTSVSNDYRAYAEEQQAIAIGLVAEGKHEEASYYYSAAGNYADKADRTGAVVEHRPVAMGEATSPGRDGPVIAWRPKNTLHKPEQVALDARSERTKLLLGPAIDVCALALDTADSIGAKDSLEKMLAHQMALSHKLALDFANRAVAQTDPIMTIKLANVGAKLMDTFQRGLLTIQKLRSGNSQTVTVQHTHVHAGGQALVAGSMQTGGQPKIRGESEGK